jgi:hypothetical protein
VGGRRGAHRVVAVAERLHGLAQQDVTLAEEIADLGVGDDPSDLFFSLIVPDLLRLLALCTRL